MPLIVEDGTGLEDANSYLSLASARDLASMRGITLNADDAELTSQLIQAADRLTSYEGRFTGERVNGDQGLSYPRKYAFRYCKPLSETAIPKELKLAQITLADYIESGYSLWASPVVEGVIREKVGPIETEYSAAVVDGAAIGNPDFAQIEAILEPLFAPWSANFTVSR